MVRLSLQAHANHFSDWLCAFVALMASLAGTVVAVLTLSSLFPCWDFLYSLFYYWELILGQVDAGSNWFWFPVQTSALA